MITEDPVTTIDLIRHGECEGGEIFRGSTDVALSPEGWNTMQAAADRLARPNGWDGIVCSPLQRCRSFAERLADAHGIPLEIMDDLREMNYGEWEGMEVKKVWQQDAERVRRLYTDAASFTSPGGEPMQQFQSRVLSSWRQILDQHRNRRLLLVIHGGTIRILLSALLDMPLGRSSCWYVPYGCSSRIRIYRGEIADRIHLDFHNGLSTA